MKKIEAKPFKVTVNVKPGSKKESLEVISEFEFLIRVRPPPTEGKANERVIELLSEHLARPKSRIELVSGHKSKKKIFEIS